MLEVTSDKFDCIEVAGFKFLTVLVFVPEADTIIIAVQDVFIRYGTAIDIGCKVLK